MMSQRYLDAASGCNSTTGTPGPMTDLVERVSS